MRLCRNRRPRRGIVCTPYDIASLQVPFAPPQLPSLAAWYTATTGLHTDGAASFAAASNQSLSRASNSGLQVGSGIDFWAACWVNLATKTADRPCVGKVSTTASSGIEWLIRYVNATDRFRLTISNGAANTSADASTLGSPTAGTWYFIFAYYDSVNGTVNISGNGGAFNSTGSAVTPQTATNNLTIGGWDGSVFQDGIEDAVTFGKNPVGGIAGLATTIRDALWNSGSGLSGKNITAAQKTAWGTQLISDFDGPGANLLIDSSGNSNTLTNNNSVTYAAGQVSTTTLVTNDADASASDQSGNGNTLAQATGLLRGIYTAADQNGLPDILFTAGSSQLMSGTFTLNQPCTIWGAFKSSTAAGTIFDGKAATAKLFQSGTTWQMNAGSALDSTIASDSNWHFFAAVFNGASSFLVVDGTQGAVGAAGANNPGGLTLASVLAGGSYDTLKAGEWGANGAALSVGQIAQLRAYIKGKWATP